MSKKNLDVLYKEKLKPYLQSVEEDRLYIKKRLYISYVLAFGLLFVVGIIYNPIAMWITLALLLIGLLWVAGTGIVKYFHYRHEFKEKIVTEIVKLINPEYKYDAYKYIHLDDFNASNIFKQAKMCRGDDEIKGRVGQVPFHFSEINAGSTPNNNPNAKIKSVFKGLFFYADFNKELSGETYVLPDKAEKLLGKLGQQFQSDRKKGELVKLENIEFEKNFVVFSSSQIEARYVLTPVMMEAITKIKKQYQLDFHFSFKGSRVNCAISFKKGLFEPQVIKNGASFADVKYIYTLFELIETIINEMNLNTRIWTKK